ncbi:receptor for retinol uptake STRA6 isoform X2 [Pelodiscus sinensis]|uniref:receptor for retinol uptake STRA6 isoform X2 n=1 Tax=Pelodiscus sinensis TaxID=13735 RepID=UPI003F6D3A0C
MANNSSLSVHGSLAYDDFASPDWYMYESTEPEMPQDDMVPSVIPACDPTIAYGLYHACMAPVSLAVLIVLSLLVKRKSLHRSCWNGAPGLLSPVDFLEVEGHPGLVAAVFGILFSSVCVLVLDTDPLPFVASSSPRTRDLQALFPAVLRPHYPLPHHPELLVPGAACPELHAGEPGCERGCREQLLQKIPEGDPGQENVLQKLQASQSPLEGPDVLPLLHLHAPGRVPGSSEAGSLGNHSCDCCVPGSPAAACGLPPSRSDCEGRDDEGDHSPAGSVWSRPFGKPGGSPWRHDTGAGHSQTLSLVTGRANLRALYRGAVLDVFCRARTLGPSQQALVCWMSFASFQTAFACLGLLIQQVIFFICAVGFSFLVVIPLQSGAHMHLFKILENMWPFWLMLVLAVLVQNLLAHFCFLEQPYLQKELTNRRALCIVTYLLFPINVLVGVLAGIWRMVISALYNAVHFCQLDVSLLTRGVEAFDPGYRTYCHYLKIEASQSHPVMKAFCVLLLQLPGPERQAGLKPTDVEEGIQLMQPAKGLLKTSKSKQMRARWGLAYTLLHNPSLLACRKAALSDPTANGTQPRPAKP